MAGYIKYAQIQLLYISQKACHFRKTPHYIHIWKNIKIDIFANN